MRRRRPRFAALFAAGTLVLGGCSSAAAPKARPQGTRSPGAHDGARESTGREIATRRDVLDGMKRATRFMLETVSTRGGYLWAYLPDFSRRWGEMEAYPSMIWVQPPGTPSVGHLLLDAYYATGDDYYYRGALRAAEALIAGQHPSGGWNYMIDFAGEASLQEWYRTIGKNGWRLEEFQHYYGNATFDDSGSVESAKLLLRLHLEQTRRERSGREPPSPAIEAGWTQALKFVLESQYPNGCWPQRYPMTPEYLTQGQPTYPADYTFNDDVAQKNIELLLLAHQALGDERVLHAIEQAMNCFVLLHLPQPQPGWSLQYTRDLKPAPARSYEPAALSLKTSASNLDLLMDFYELTLEPKYLERVEETLQWLQACRLSEALLQRLPPHARAEGHTHPTLVSVGDNLPLFLHRRGSNVVNGQYYVDHEPEKTITHTRSTRLLDVEQLRARWQRLLTLPAEQLAATSPLKAAPGSRPLARYFTRAIQQAPEKQPSLDVPELLSSLNAQGYWPVPLPLHSHPYRGPGPRTAPDADYSETLVGDAYDTSPYKPESGPVGISTATYIANMAALIRALEQLPRD